MYGSNFWSWTRKPRETSRRPIEAAAIPFPSEETTPPVTKMKRVPPGSIMRFTASFTLPSESRARSGGIRSIVSEIDRNSP